MWCGDPAISLCEFASRADRFDAVSRMSPNRLGVPKGGDVSLNWSASYWTLLSRLKAFNENEEGAITVEWVVITAGICTLAMSMYMVFKIDPR